MIRHRRLLIVACLAVGLMMAIGGTPASADLVGFWPLNDGAGNVADNRVEGGADGAIFNHQTGGPTDGSVWVKTNDARLGNRTVIGFGGQAPADTAFVRAGEIPRMTLENDFSWSFWANQDPAIAASPGQFAGIVGNRYQPGPGRVDYAPRQFIKFTPTAFEWHMNANGNDNLSYKPDPDDPMNDVTPGVWEHHAVTKDGDKIVYYRDGVQWNEGTITQALDLPMPLWFGGDDAGDAVEQWHGLLAAVRTFDHALSPEEVGRLAVPEPSAILLLGLGLLPFLTRRRS